MKKFYYIEADGYNPYRNLALEEAMINLATSSNEDIYILYFWKNRDSVIFGRNQNPVTECNFELMKKLDILPVRRKTGGGAVYHDIHNLNFSLIVPKQYYEKKQSMNIIRDAMISMGISAEVNDRNDILLDGYKFSGSAYSSNEKVSLHHGTLLFETDFGRLEKVLTVSEKKLKRHGIKSVRSRVMNLKSKFPNLTESECKDAIKKYFVLHYGGDEYEMLDVSILPGIDELQNMYQSEDWIFGKMRSIEE